MGFERRMWNPLALAAMLPLLVAGTADTDVAEHARYKAASAALSAYSREVIAVDKGKYVDTDRADQIMRQLEVALRPGCTMQKMYGNQETDSGDGKDGAAAAGSCPAVRAPAGLLSDAVLEIYLLRQRILKVMLLDRDRHPPPLQLWQVDAETREDELVDEDFADEDPHFTNATTATTDDGADGAAAAAVRPDWLRRPLKMVLRHTADDDLDAMGRLGRSAAILAASYNDRASLVILASRIDFGAPQGGGVDANGWRPYDYAHRGCFRDIERLLNNQGDPGEDLSTVCCEEAAKQEVGQQTVETSIRNMDIQEAQWKLYKESGWRLPRLQAIPDLPRCTDQLASIPAAELTVENFTKYATMLVPLVLVDTTAGWELAESLKKNALLEMAGSDDVQVSSIPYGEVFGVDAGEATVREMTEFMDRVAKGKATKSERFLMVFDPWLLDTRFKGQYALPPAIFEVLGTPDTVAHQLYMGPSMTGAPFHFHEDALNALVYGVKQWTLEPPARAIYSTNHPKSKAAKEDLPKDDSLPIVCLQYPGDLLYVPRGWSHSTVNIAETIGIAVEIDGSSCDKHRCAAQLV